MAMAVNVLNHYEEFKIIHALMLFDDWSVRHL